MTGIKAAGDHRLAPLAALGRRSGDPGRLHFNSPRLTEESAGCLQMDAMRGRV